MMLSARRFLRSAMTLSVLAGSLLVALPQARAQVALSTITYQGQLLQSGAAYTGTATITMKMYDALTAGAQLGSAVTFSDVNVTNGLFTVSPDFGAAAFTGKVGYIEIAVTLPGEGGPTILSPRQTLTAAPFALALPFFRTIATVDGIGNVVPSVLGGGAANAITAGTVGGTISGGNTNTIMEDWATISGGVANTAKAYATVGGGTTNTASGPRSTVGGGSGNIASGVHTTVAGGGGNLAIEQQATVGGGNSNAASGIYSTVAGGGGNAASGQQSTVSGGTSNTASGTYATVAGGSFNTASGQYATVGGGASNNAAGNYGFAAGWGATVRAADTGTFVWADSSTSGSPFTSTGLNQFLIRATGGVGIGTASPQYALHVVTNSDTQIALTGGPATGATIPPRTWTIQSSNVSGPPGSQLTGSFQVIDRTASAARLLIDINGNVGIGTTAPAYRLDVNGSLRCFAFTNSSDARLKTNIAPLTDALDAVTHLRGVTFDWNDDARRKTDLPTGPQIGFIAQEVERVLPQLVSTDRSGFKSVSYVNVVPVLVEAVKQQQKQFDAYKSDKQREIDALKAENNRNQQRLAALEAQMAKVLANKGAPEPASR